MCSKASRRIFASGRSAQVSELPLAFGEPVAAGALGASDPARNLPSRAGVDVQDFVILCVIEIEEAPQSLLLSSGQRKSLFLTDDCLPGEKLALFHRGDKVLDGFLQVPDIVQGAFFKEVVGGNVGSKSQRIGAGFWAAVFFFRDMLSPFSITVLLLHAAVLELLPATARTRIVRPTFCLASGLQSRSAEGAGGTGGLDLRTSAAFLPVSFSRANSHNHLGVALKFLHPLPVLFLLGLLNGKPP